MSIIHTGSKVALFSTQADLENQDTFIGWLGPLRFPLPYYTGSTVYTDPKCNYFMFYQR